MSSDSGTIIGLLLDALTLDDFKEWKSAAGSQYVTLLFQIAHVLHDHFLFVCFTNKSKAKSS